MFQIKPEHDGCIIKFKFKDGGRLAGFEEVEGRVQYDGGSYIYILSNSKWLNGGNPGIKIRYPEYKYCYTVTVNSTINRSSLTENLMQVTIENNEILVKIGNAGDKLFRRIHRIEPGMMFLGPIRKDSEECKKPSGFIQVMDSEFMKNDGWEVLRREPSVEERAAKVKPKINI